LGRHTMSMKALRSVLARIDGQRGARCVQLGLLLAAGPAILPVVYAQTGTQIEIRSHLQIADADMKAGNGTGAERELRAVLALEPANAEAHAKLGFLLFMRAQWADAAAHLQQALQAQPGQANTEAVLGMCEKRLGKTAEARQSLQDSFPQLPAGRLKTQAGLDLAEILYENDDLDRAVDVVRTLLPLDPQNPDVLYTAARVYADLANRSRDALALAAPNSGRTHQLMAEFLINKGDAHGAIRQFRKALELSPTLGGVHYELGDAILLDSREPPALDAAEKEFRTAQAENPQDANAEYRLGTICSLRKDYKRAIGHYTRALQLRPDNAHAEQELGWAWFKLGDSQKGLEHLAAATRLDPLFPAAHYQLSAVYKQLGRADDSQREMAAFEKLQNSRQQIDQVYFRTRPSFEDIDAAGASATKN
jgi:tetratricopeptide (TPR) repeat protein